MGLFDTFKKDEDCVVSYNGIKEFVGRRCTNNLVQRYNDGRIILVEMYAGFTPYYMLQFLFVYDDGNVKEADTLKSAFSGL